MGLLQVMAASKEAMADGQNDLASFSGYVAWQMCLVGLVKLFGALWGRAVRGLIRQLSSKLQMGLEGAGLTWAELG